MPIRIPTRFEHVLNNPNLNPTPLIVGVEADLQSIDRLRRTADTQQGGVLAFLYAPTGAGKTTAVYSAAALMADTFDPVLLVPHTVTLRGVSQWLRDNLPQQTGKAIPVLFDGREATDDVVGLGQMMSDLNSLLRGRPDLIALWPTTSDEWRAQLSEIANRIGGRSLVPANGEVRIEGPEKAEWFTILERLLGQFDQRFEDLALDERSVMSYVEKAESVGGFLEKVRDAIVDRVDEVQLQSSLPPLIFVVSSGPDVVSEANRLRRAGSLLLKAEELLSYSPRSVAGKYWKARLATPEHHLAYVISLFQARLTTMSPSSVAYAVREFGDEHLQSVARDAGMQRSPGNADRTFQSTDLYKYLTGNTSFEMTSSAKGRTADTTVTAYEAIQRLSSTRHKAINQALSALVERNVPEFKGSLAQFELDLGGANAFADAVVPFEDGDIYLEFHHLSPAHLTAAAMASYVMGKLQSYAIHYNLIPR